MRAKAMEQDNKMKELEHELANAHKQSDDEDSDIGNEHLKQEFEDFRDEMTDRLQKLEGMIGSGIKTIIQTVKSRKTGAKRSLRSSEDDVPAPKKRKKNASVSSAKSVQGKGRNKKRTLPGMTICTQI